MLPTCKGFRSKVEFVTKRITFSETGCKGCLKFRDSKRQRVSRRPFPFLFYKVPIILYIRFLHLLPLHNSFVRNKRKKNKYSLLVHVMFPYSRQFSALLSKIFLWNEANLCDPRDSSIKVEKSLIIREKRVKKSFELSVTLRVMRN